MCYFDDQKLIQKVQVAFFVIKEVFFWQKTVVVINAFILLQEQLYLILYANTL